MGAASGSSQTLFSSDVASIATGADSAASGELTIPDNIRQMQVQLKLTGNAAGSGTATAYIVASLDGTNFETGGTPITCAIASGAKVGNVAVLDVSGVRKVKCSLVHNGDPAQAITAVNVIATLY